MLTQFLLATLCATSTFSTWNIKPVIWSIIHGEPTNNIQSFHQTFYKTDDEAYTRAHNIEHAANLLRPSSILPGEDWSFNDTLGPRTFETGFLPAPTLAFGEIVEDFGGGVCQVSSTMFAVALKAGLVVLERHPHARASNYIANGFDATVNLPPECFEKNDPRFCYDLRLRNPYDFPLVWHARAKDGELTVWLTGDGPVARVSTRWKTGDASPFKKRWVRKYYPGHKPKRKQSGSNGLDGTLFVDITWPNGRTEHLTMISSYKPVDEVWYVGTDWNKDNNPWE